MGALEKYVDGSKREEALRSKERHETANKLMDEGKFDDAIILYQENLNWSLETLGKNHNCTVSDQEALAQAFYSARNFEEARKLDQAALSTRVLIEGTNPPSKELLEVQLSLAQDNVGLKKYREAAKIYADVYKRYKDDDIQGLKVGYDLAACWHHSRNYEKSQDLNQKILQQRIKIGASEEQIAQSIEALKQNLKKIESARKKKEALEKKAAEKSENMKSTEKTEISQQEKSRETASQANSEVQTDLEAKATKDTQAEMMKDKDEKGENGLGEVEARALERKRLARESRIIERKEKWEKRENRNENKARSLRKDVHTEATKEANEIPSEGVEGRAPLKSKEFMKDFRSYGNFNDDFKSVAQEQWPVSKSTDRLKEPDSEHMNDKQGNSRRRASSHSYQPPRRPMVPELGTNQHYSDEVWLSGRKTYTPENNPLPFSASSKNAKTSHLRSSSQDSRDAKDKIQFRHVSISDMFQQLKSAQGSSNNTGDEIPFSVPGLVVSDDTSIQQPALIDMPQRPKTGTFVVSRCLALQVPTPSVKPGQSVKPPPDLSRSRSVNNPKEKNVISARSKSVSPTTGQKNPTRKFNVKPKVEIHQSQLFDAKGGKDDDDSAYAAESWFQFLESETQKVLSPLRRTRGKRVKIAILDTGIDVAHPDFKEDQAASGNKRIKAPEDFLNPEGKAHDTCGHGTHCVGLLRKVAPYADVYVARVAKDFDDNLNPDVVAKAIIRACSDGKDKDGKRNWNVDIITMSFGFYNIAPVVRNAIRQALARPVLIFAAASNNGTRRDVAFPASMTGVFCINSANGDGGPSKFNPELKPDQVFSIIGENVKSSWTTDENATPHKSMTGTSVATPIAAAVAALVLEYVIQNDPESFLVDQLDEFKEYDGMSKIFSLMSRTRDGYKNIVPWELLTSMAARRSITGRIEWEMKGFGGR
ncbi:hypothetical protein VTL71DRAFT_15716 [Oculimacula yallundae]|uniref:Peptidase S8/S53 domain-containing protein n=1 Tax=Oculimacula yallundae TaxID=86028 RepID=A0ABR4CCF7_9HELO